MYKKANLKESKKTRGYGGMVDANDLKSFDLCGRKGSSPFSPIQKIE